MTYLLKSTFIQMLLITILTMLWKLGYLGLLITLDPTYICVSIISILLFFSFYLISRIYKLDCAFESKKSCPRLILNLELVEKFGLLLSETFVALGLVGTIIGMMMVFQALGTVDVSNVNNIKALIIHLSGGLSVAMTTTLVAILCNLFLKFHINNLHHGIENIKYIGRKKEK